MSGPADGALPVRRSYPVATERLTGLVVEIDPSRNESALAVLQAQLHESVPGQRLIFGYELTLTGLAAWVGDRRLRLRIWPAHLGDDGEITEDHPDDGGDELLIDFDPVADGAGLDHLEVTGRVIIAGPDAGPIPLVVDLDTDELTALRARLRDG